VECLVTDRLVVSGRGGDREVSLPPGRAVVLGGVDADVRVEGAGDEALRFVPIDGGVRVEPARAGGRVVVNGESLFCKDLRSGDIVTLGALRLRFVASVVVAAPRAATDRAGGRVAAAPRERGRRGGTLRPRRSKTWIPVVSIVCVLIAIGVLVVRRLSTSTWPSSPQHFVDLARAQLQNNQPQHALDTLAFALPEATGPTRTEALELEKRIRAMLLAVAEMPKVVAARQEHDFVTSFAAMHGVDGAGRPVAREIVRLCDQWLARHAEVCGRHPDGGPLLTTVRGLRERHAPAAALGEPDSTADVIFAAEARVRLQWRDYLGAMERLEAFLQRHPGDAQVVAARERLLAEGEAWVQARIRGIELLLARGDRDNAARDLAQLDRWSLLPAWQEHARTVRARLRE
jgi:hypothetical protein